MLNKMLSSVNLFYMLGQQTSLEDILNNPLRENEMLMQDSSGIFHRITAPVGSSDTYSRRLISWIQSKGNTVEHLEAMKNLISNFESQIAKTNIAAEGKINEIKQQQQTLLKLIHRSFIPQNEAQIEEIAQRLSSIVEGAQEKLQKNKEVLALRKEKAAHLIDVDQLLGQSEGEKGINTGNVSQSEHLAPIEDSKKSSKSNLEYELLKNHSKLMEDSKAIRQKINVSSTFWIKDQEEFNRYCNSSIAELQQYARDIQEGVNLTKEWKECIASQTEVLARTQSNSQFEGFLEELDDARKIFWENMQDFAGNNKLETPSAVTEALFTSETSLDSTIFYLKQEIDEINRGSHED